MKKRICITVEIDEEKSEWSKLKRFLKGILRCYGLRCVALAEPVAQQQEDKHESSQ